MGGGCHYQIFSGAFIQTRHSSYDYRVWYYLEKYTKFPLVFLFKPLVAMTAFKLGQTQRSLYDLEDGLLRSKTSLEVEHYIEFGQFSNN